MVSRLPPPDEKNRRDHRAELDSLLGVVGWAMPGRRQITTVQRPAGAPAWWFGDEEASQSFLRSRGVKLSG
jgi:hypothetical protein